VLRLGHPLRIAGAVRTWPPPTSAIINEDCLGGPCVHTQSEYFIDGPLPSGFECIFVYLDGAERVVGFLAMYSHPVNRTAVEAGWRRRLGPPTCTRLPLVPVWVDAHTVYAVHVLIYAAQYDRRYPGYANLLRELECVPLNGRGDSS
jgi:hypothetical protein